MRMRKSLLLFVGSVLSVQASDTLTGTVTDTMCGAKHMMENVSAAECTRQCVKQGSDYGLVANGKVYTLKGDKAQFDNFAGKDVTVNGKLDGDTFKVDSVSANK